MFETSAVKFAACAAAEHHREDPSLPGSGSVHSSEPRIFACLRARIRCDE